jgi:hypothetical protein
VEFQWAPTEIVPYGVSEIPPILIVAGGGAPLAWAAPSVFDAPDDAADVGSCDGGVDCDGFD